jgi:hypothetical protein
MIEQDWALLGLEPTTELTAIKKAYALRLKVTRPDDDAEAYQALRAAYERSLQWARWTQQDEGAPGAAPARAEPPAPPPATHSEVDVVAPSLADEAHVAAVAPQELIAQVDALWHQQGDAALLESWASLQHRLGGTALGQVDEVSTAFARWVLDRPRLPNAFVSALNDHFGWLGDFRAERQIGSMLVANLHDALDGRLTSHGADPELQRQAAPILQMHRILDRWWGAAAPLLAAGIGPGLERLYASLDAGSRRRLGLHEREQTHLSTAFDMAFVVRLGLCLLPLALIGFAGHVDSASWGWSMIGWLVCGLVGMGFTWGASACFRQGFGPGRPGIRYRIRLQSLREQRWAPGLALALLAVAITLSAGGFATQHVMSSSVPTATTEPIEGVRSITLIDSQALRWSYWIDLVLPMALGIAAIVIGWPLAALSGQVIAGQVLLLTYIVQLGVAGPGTSLWRGLEGPDVIVAIQGGISMATTWLGCWIWLLVGAFVHEQRLPNWPWLPWLVRPVTNLLGMGERWSLPMAVAPALTLCGVFWMLDRSLGWSTALFFWAICILAFAHVQNSLESRGLRWLRGLSMRG